MQARKLLVWTALFATILTFCGAAAAQDTYPTRLVKMIVPVPPGPTADLMPRIIADKLAARWRQPVIVENRPGAGLNLAAEFVAKSPPDGYTLLATPQGPLVISESLFPKLRFDPAAFVPVSVYAEQPYLLLANPRVPASTLREFIAFAKANPGKINSAGGAGDALHLTAEMLAAAADVRFVNVPYQGAGPALTDLLAGHIDIMINNLGNSLSLIREGKLKVFGVAGKTRIPELPDVPAIAELYPDFYSVGWYGVVAPPGTPTAIALKLSQAIADVVHSPEVAKRFGELSITPTGMTPADMATFLRQETDRWRRVIASAGIKAN